MNSQTKIWLWGSIITVILAVTVFFVFFYKAKLTVLTSPTSATVTVGGQKINGTAKLNPGAYHISIAADGYIGAERDIKLSISQLKTLTVNLEKIPSASSITTDASFASVDAGQNSVYYLGNKGTQFYMADGDPVLRPITAARFQSITNVMWDSTHQFIIYRSSDDHLHLFNFKRYDLLNQEDTDLGGDLKSTVWAPDSSAIISFNAPATGERTLLRHQISTGALDQLIDLRSSGLNNPTLSWSPDGKTLALVEKNLYLFDINTKTLSTMTNTSDVTAVTWSPDSQKLLAQTSNGLSIFDRTTNKLAPTTLATTLLKTSWLANGMILAAIPTSTKGDQFVRFDSTTNTTSEYLFSSSAPVSATNILVSPTMDTAWFISNGNLETTPLKLQ